jgi:hypothetical protein
MDRLARTALAEAVAQAMINEAGVQTGGNQGGTTMAV